MRNGSGRLPFVLLSVIISDNQWESEPRECGTGHDQPAPQTLQAQPVSGVPVRRHGGPRAADQCQKRRNCEQKHGYSHELLTIIIRYNW